MSSKFPALEEIDQDLAPANTADDFDEDFLAREKAALGADATEFQTSEDAVLGGPTDEISGFNASFPALENSDVSGRGRHYLLISDVCRMPELAHQVSFLNLLSPSLPRK